jgi:hypothetical protein
VTDTGIYVSTLVSDSSLRGLMVGVSFVVEGALPPLTPATKAITTRPHCLQAQ